MPNARIITILVVIACALAACGESAASEKASKAAAKQKKDQELLALPYPKSTGTLPRSMQVRYDPTGDRTEMTLQFPGLKTASGGVGPLTLTLTSSHKGRVRGADNPEGSIDASAAAVSSNAGSLAFAGAPGVIVIDGNEMELIEPSGGSAYMSVPASGGTEEVVRCRVPTPAIVAAANGGSVAFRFAGKEFPLSAPQVADLKEFAARLDPTP